MNQPEQNQASRVAVIGAGPMGLASAYELTKKGWQVDLYERDDRIGGMSASFDFDGMQLERFYHFVCATDQTLFDYLEEVGLRDRLQWRDIKMGFYYHGKLYPWGNPIALLKFPHMSLLAKFRFSLHVMYTKSIKNWDKLDKIHATDWLKRWLGKQAYDVVWEPLFRLKFFEYQDALSAAWIGTRIKRVALSRKNLMVEREGYIEGGSEVLLHAIKERIEAAGGTIHLQQGVDEVLIDEGKARGVRVNGEDRAYGAVVSTIPLPYLVKLGADLPQPELEKIRAIQNIGVVCVTLKLKHPFSENFWMNINEPSMDIPGLIEYSNLNPLPQPVVYAPFYMPQTHPDYKAGNQHFIDKTVGVMQQIRPDFSPDEILATNVHRYEFAQTVCKPGFYEQLPPMDSAVKGLYLADTSHYYPNDRSISESMAVGKRLAGYVDPGN